MKKLGRFRCHSTVDGRCVIDAATPHDDPDTEVGEHIGTLSREHHHIIADDRSYYIYRRSPKRRSTTDVPSRLELLSQRLKSMNDKNSQFWAERQRVGKVAADGK